MNLLNEAVNTACEWVKRGGLIAYPTESVFGIGCDPQNNTALERLLDAKSRDASKGLILVASRIEQLADFIAPLAQDVQARIEATWPGPVTWIVPAANRLSPLLTGNRPTLAVRVSAHPVVQQLCRQLEHPIVSTSANLSGEPALTTASSVVETLGTTIDFVIDAPTGGDEKPTSIFDALTGEQLR